MLIQLTWSINIWKSCVRLELSRQTDNCVERLWHKRNRCSIINIYWFWQVGMFPGMPPTNKDMLEKMFYFRSVPYSREEWQRKWLNSQLSGPKADRRWENHSALNVMLRKKKNIPKINYTWPLRGWFGLVDVNCWQRCKVAEEDIHEEDSVKH